MLKSFLLSVVFFIAIPCAYSHAKCFTYQPLSISQSSKHVCYGPQGKGKGVVIRITAIRKGMHCYLRIINKKRISIKGMKNGLSSTALDIRRYRCGTLRDQNGQTVRPLRLFHYGNPRFNWPKRPKVTWGKVVTGKQKCVRYIWYKNRETKVTSYICLHQKTPQYSWVRWKKQDSTCYLVFEELVPSEQQATVIYPNGKKETLTFRSHLKVERERRIVCGYYSVVSRHEMKKEKRSNKK